MVKDLVVDNIDGQVIYFCDEAARIAKPIRNNRDELDKNKPITSMPIVSVKIGDHFYHGLCDIGASVSAIPFTLYHEIMNGIVTCLETASVFPQRGRDDAAQRR